MQKLIVTEPTALEIVHYFKDTFSLTITMLDSGGNVIDLTGFTGAFNILTHPESSSVLVNPAVTFDATLGKIYVNGAVSIYSGLNPGTYYYYNLILTSSNTEALIAGKYNFTNKPTNNSSSSSVTIYKTTQTLQITASAISANKPNYGSGTTAQRAAKKSQLIATSAPAMSYLWFDTSENTFYGWSGSDWV